MSEERRIEKFTDKLVKLWPIAAVLVAGLTGYIRLEIAVSNVSKLPEVVATLKDRVTVLETQLAFIKERYRDRHGR